MLNIMPQNKSADVS